MPPSCRHKESKKINLRVKFHDILKEKAAKTHCLQEGNIMLTLPGQPTVGNLLAQLELAENWVGLVVVNGRQAQPDTALKNNDRVELFSPMVGG